MRTERRRFQHCLCCGSKTEFKIWVGDPEWKEDYVCSDKCFTRLCSVCLPTEEGRANAKKKLIEKGWE